MTSRETIDLWDAEAATFDEAADHGLRDPDVRTAWRDLLTQVMPRPPSTVADLGSGTGTLSLLLADEGHTVVGLDVSPEMVRLAQEKAGERTDVRFFRGDAAQPDLPPGRYDVVLCRHVLWALPDPAEALRRWIDLLAPDGRLVLIEGNWSTGAGLTATQTVALVEATGRSVELRRLPEATYWGREITDERYLVVSR